MPFGTKAGKDFIYESINDLLEVPFMPQSYREDGKASIFYVEMTSSSLAAVQSINKRITMPNGFKVLSGVTTRDTARATCRLMPLFHCRCRY